MRIWGLYFSPSAFFNVYFLIKRKCIPVPFCSNWTEALGKDPPAPAAQPAGLFGASPARSPAPPPLRIPRTPGFAPLTLFPSVSVFLFGVYGACLFYLLRCF